MRTARPGLRLQCLVASWIVGVGWLTSPAAQVAGRNVNMVTGGTFPGGDPYLQKQNEPSLAISTRNACHLLAGANDYRAVNLPGLPADQEVGDAWVGWYESTDCGATWYSTLVPGFSQDQSAQGVASPVKGLTAAADPVLKSGAAGTFYYLFIAFNRGSNVGKLALARAIDHNDRESYIDPNQLEISADSLIDPRRPRSPIQYVGTTEIARGSAGQFIDKPSMAVFPAPSGTCTMDGETVPATSVFMAWTEFVGNSPENQRSKIYFARSNDCGRTLAGPATKLSEGYPLGQGTAIAVNPTNPDDIYVVWRQIRTERNRDALLYARSVDGGRSFTRAEYIPGLGEGQFAPFDQNTTSKARGHITTTFRTVAYPTLAFADDGFLYLAVSQVPGGWDGRLGGTQARITLTRTNGAGWVAPTTISVAGAPPADGQQFMPALAYAAGKLQLIWYDVRFDEAGLTDERFIDDEKGLSDPSIRRRRTIDVLGGQATLPSVVFPPTFAAYGVSQPDYNDTLNNTIPLRGPRLSQYLTGDPAPGVNQSPAGPRQLLFNRGGLLLYGGGTIPFMGDYIDVAPIPFVWDALTGRWTFNGLTNSGKAALATFQAAWTDNRDANVGKATTSPVPGDPATLRFDYQRPLLLAANQTINSASCEVPGVDNTRTRDANVYTSRITQDFSLTVPVNSKPNTAGVIRSFAMQLTNNRELTPPPATGPEPPETPTTYTLTIGNNVRASFSRASFTINGLACTEAATPVRQISVKVLPRASIARTLYVPCGTSGPIAVTATDTSTGASASVMINGDPANPGTVTADGSPLGPESHNPDAENPDAENPDAENPDAENPDAENPDAENPDAENPDAENPDAENPDAENPDAENPDAENPDAENASFQDISADVTNDGNTTSAYQVQAGVAGDTTGYQFLLLGRRVYSTPTTIRCHLVQKRTNQMLFSIPLSAADLSGDFHDENDESEKHPTFLLRPGESVRVTLRVVWDRSTQGDFCTADGDSADCFEKVLIRTQAQAPNTGELEPREDAEGEFADLTVDGSVAAPAVAGLGGIVDMPATTIRNDGSRAAEATTFDGEVDFRWDYYRSTDQQITARDVAFGVGEDASTLAPGGTIAFPARRLIMPFSTGQLYLGVLADPDNVIRESSESNNSLVTPTAVTVVPYYATVAVQQINNPDDPRTSRTIVSVTVQQWTGPESSTPVAGARVSLGLERPIAPTNEPGVAVSGFSVPEGTTDAGGTVEFTLPEPLPGSGETHRFVPTVTIDGVAAPLKFQSGCYGAGCPVILR